MDGSVDKQVKGAISRVAGEGVTTEISQQNYKQWAKDYDKELLSLNYKAHTLVAEFLQEYYSPEERRTVKILDVGAGTGLAARALKTAGFEHIDALEPCEEMLEVARRDQLYKQYFVEYLTDKPLDIPGNSYDAVTGSGIFAEGGHVPAVALFEMARLVKPGGYVVLSTRVNVVEETEENKELEPTMLRMEAEGRWKRLKRDTQTKLYSDRQAIVFVFQVL